MNTPDELVRQLLPVVRRFRAGPGSYGIALGGSYAKGTSDALSDVDVYLFASAALPGAQRNEVVAEALGLAAGSVASWGRDEPFEQGGTDFRLPDREVECWLRNADRIRSEIAGPAAISAYLNSGLQATDPRTYVRKF
jgi:predicted nucleotidyltransferase